MRYTFIDSPLGALLAARDDIGITSLYLPSGRNPVSAIPGGQRDDDAFEDLRTQLDEYFDGSRREFHLPMHARGTAFQQRVWRALCDIPYGQTRSYGEIAAAAGGSARSVGQANGCNPIPIIIPCHRVVAASDLGGYSCGEGLATKRFLLALETGPG
jgi:methylated-DNA-[protein]-cysteine S-methyltransferase